jgi:hypothetical protein
MKAIINKPVGSEESVLFSKDDYARTIRNEMRLDKIEYIGAHLRIGVWAIVAAAIPIIIEGFLILMN